METESLYLLAADLVLILHFLFVLFVVFGLLFIFIGKWFNWSWVRNRKFRITHLLAIGIVVTQAWIGVICPLTTWEMALREKAGDATYTGSFIAHWVESMLYYQAPPWVFTLLYTGFGMLVLASWFWVRPHKRK